MSLGKGHHLYDVILGGWGDGSEGNSAHNSFGGLGFDSLSLISGHSQLLKDGGSVLLDP